MFILYYFTGRTLLHLSNMSDFVDSEAEESGEELDDTKDQDEQGGSSICLESPYD